MEHGRSDTSQYPGIYSRLCAEALHRQTHTREVKGQAAEGSRGVQT